jgi:hypothetical protein
MRRAAFVLVFLAACASSQQSSGPNVQIAITQQGLSPDLYYFRGPVSLQYQLAISNPTNQPITLRRLDLQTEGQGAYSLRTSGPFNLTIPANSTATQNVYAWGYARGGLLTQGEPVTMRISAMFADASGKGFQRIAIQNLQQP